MEKEDTAQRVHEAVIAKLKSIIAEGKDIFAGYFCGPSGDPLLTVSHHSDTQVSICYCYGSRMWNWIEDKTNIYEQ